MTLNPYGYPRTTINEVEYACPYQLRMEIGSNNYCEIRTEPPTRRPANICEHCHRFDMVEVVARSFDEAIELGWLIPIPSTAS